MSSLLLVFNLVDECHDLSHSVFHVQSTTSMYRLNWFPLLTWLNWVESYNLTKCVLYGDFSKFSLIFHSLFLLIINTQMFLPSPPLGIW